MAALILPSRRILLPQQGVALDREKVKETGTIYLGLPGAEFRDLVGGVSLTNPGGLAAAEKGRVATFNGAQQANKALTLPNGYRNVIIAARIRATAAQAGDPGAAFGLYNGTAVQSGMGVGFDPSNNVGLAVLTSNAAALPQRSPGVIGKWYTVFVQYEGATTNGAAVAYVDGRRVVTGYGAAVSGATDPANEISIGAQHRSSGFLRQFKGDIEWAALMYLPRDSWQSLTDDVALRLYESGYPYNLLKPIERRIWVEVGGGGGVTGSLSATEAGQDSLAASGVVRVLGSLSATEAGSDTAAISGSVRVQGSLSVTESGADTFAASGTVSSGVNGSLNATEAGSDAFAASGSVRVSGSLSAVESGADTAAISGSVAVSGSLSASEAGQDTFSASGVASSVTGSLGATEQGSDTALILGEGVTLDQPRTAGFVITDTAPRMWWQRKPKALDDEEAEQRVKRVVRVVERIARAQVEQPNPAPQKVRKAEVREAIAPLVEQMPGFDWMAVYRTVLIELERRKQEEQALELAAAEIARIRAIEQDDEDVLLLLMSV